MKRQLRLSGYKDYVAIDILDEDNLVISTPFYLQYNSIGYLIYKGMKASCFIYDHGLICKYLESSEDFKLNFVDLLSESECDFNEAEARTFIKNNITHTS